MGSVIQECPASPGRMMRRDPKLALASPRGSRSSHSPRSPRSPRTPRTPGGRRASLGQGMGMLLMRTNSLTRLFPGSRTKRDSTQHSSSWAGGHDSTSEFSWGNASFASMGSSSADNEQVAITDLLREISENIDRLVKCKKQIDKTIESNLALAKARYLDLERHHICAILPMRKAHHNKTIQAYTAAARFQLEEIRQRVQTAMEPDSQFDIDVAQERFRVKEILAGLKKAKNPVPSDEELIKQVQKMIDNEVS